MAADLDHAEQPPVLESKIHLEGESFVLADGRRQGFLSGGGKVVDQRHVARIFHARG